MQTETYPIYNTLEEIRLRKDQLSDAIGRDEELIATLWNDTFTKKEDSTRSEYITSVIVNSITVIDTFLLVRKLMKTYGGIFTFFSKKKKKRR